MGKCQKKLSLLVTKLIYIRKAKFILFSLYIVSSLIGCTFETPDTDVPVISNKSELVEKSFFVNSAKVDTGKTKPKKFICGWASENEQAKGNQWVTHKALRAYHCNLEWQITEKYIVGKMIDPSRPNNRKLWESIILIPIKSHYHYEKSKDSYGRDTNKFIKNVNRDAWNLRPYMDLDFHGVQIKKWAFNLTPTNSQQTIKVSK
jgi:hypothetical protein